jgi:leader peptidase (prepilin peptidase)/N-methyltransferase
MLDLLRSQTSLFVAAAFMFGLVVGSFLNVVIWRLPRMMEYGWLADIAGLFADRGWQIPDPMRKALADFDARPMTLSTPRSACPSCGQRITALQNVPVLSYLWLRGRCAGCGTRISTRYPIVELTSAALTALAAGRFGVSPAFCAAIVLVWALVALALIDFDTQLLPDSITLPLVWVGVALNFFGALTDLRSAVIGAIAGYLCLWSVYWLFKLATGREGMGFGDFKLLAGLGAFLGWQMLPLVVLLSSVVGSVIGIVLIVLARRGREVPMPFGPYLAVSGLIALFYGHDLTRAYLNIL